MTWTARGPRSHWWWGHRKRTCSVTVRYFATLARWVRDRRMGPAFQCCCSGRSRQDCCCRVFHYPVGVYSCACCCPCLYSRHTVTEVVHYRQLDFE
uniref:Uncharacterized protein n=1 Tax=Arundo donax TaxID=35708 RepID=A0A0A9DV16_ARUDO